MDKPLLEDPRIPSVSKHGQLYVPISGVEPLLAVCEEAGATVIGIEGFRITEHVTRPDMDLIADYSEAPASDWEEFRSVCHKSARSFWGACVNDSELLFDVVLLTESEWQEARS